jgi:N-methylhydantoinase B
MTACSIDALTLAVIQAGLQQVCNEMDIAFSRAAFSPVIAEADDRADGIYDRHTGALIAQGEYGLPVFVGTMQYSTRELIRLIREDKVAAPEPGDIYIVNDPYLGGTHLMDVRFAKPVFLDGALFCWLQNTGHWPDIGGMVPGGFSAKATEIEQEGLRLPPVKLFKRGEMDREIFAIISSNIRIAEQRIGDIKAQAAALLVGELRLNELLARYGRAVVEEAIGEIRRRSAQRMRAEIRQIPDGTYRASAFVDSDGVVNAPLEIALAVNKSGETLRFDFTGSSPPCRGPMNSVVATTLSAVYLGVKHLFPDIPINAGTYEPLEIVGLEGTFLDARYPRPVSGCAAEVSQRIAEAVFLALVQAIPDLVTAAPAGTSGNFALGGFDPQTNAGYVMYQITGGGYGGNVQHDGLTNGCSTIGISKTPPVEVMEQYYPVLFRKFALREGSGGVGWHRGGFGVHYEVELLRGEASASFVMDHGRFGPPGVLGAADGAPNVVRIHHGDTTSIPEHLSKDQDIRIVAGDRVEVMTPGGGGYGDPAARDPALVARDVRRGYFTAEEARQHWGVVLAADGAPDLAATAALRAKGLPRTA